MHPHPYLEGVGHRSTLQALKVAVGSCLLASAKLAGTKSMLALQFSTSDLDGRARQKQPELAWQASYRLVDLAVAVLEAVGLQVNKSHRVTLGNTFWRAKCQKWGVRARQPLPYR
jgi:hypothetical protein